MIKIVVPLVFFHVYNVQVILFVHNVHILILYQVILAKNVKTLIVKNVLYHLIVFIVY